MAKLPPNYTQNVQLIQSLRSLPATKTSNTGQIGYTANTIWEVQNSLFPTATLTLAQVTSLLYAGVAQGVYLYGGCSNTTLTSIPTGCTATSNSNQPTSNQLFYLNTAMACVNTINKAYTALAYTFDPSQQRLGYLPCGAQWGLPSNPYAGATNIAAPGTAGTFGSARFAGSGWNSYTTSVNLAPAPVALTCPSTTVLP